MATNENRWSSALDERVTNDDEQRRTNHFSVRSSCVLHRPVFRGEVTGVEPPEKSQTVIFMIFIRPLLMS